jgi:hypothetical protein
MRLASRKRSHTNDIDSDVRTCIFFSDVNISKLIRNFPHRKSLTTQSLIPEFNFQRPFFVDYFGHMAWRVGSFQLRQYSNQLNSDHLEMYLTMILIVTVTFTKTLHGDLPL